MSSKSLLRIVNLKNKTVNYFTSKRKALFRKSSLSRTSKVWQNRRQVHGTKYSMPFYRSKVGKLGGLLQTKVYESKMGVPSILAVHCQGCDSLLLVGCCCALRKFLSSCWDSPVVFTFEEGSSLPVRSIIGKNTGHEHSPSWAPNSILNSISFYWFSLDIIFMYPWKQSC